MYINPNTSIHVETIKQAVFITICSPNYLCCCRYNYYNILDKFGKYKIRIGCDL